MSKPNNKNVVLIGSNIAIRLDQGPIAWVVAQCVDYIHQFSITDAELKTSQNTLILCGTIQKSES